MKTLKRTLAMILVLALSVSMFAVAAMATYTSNFKPYTDAAAAKASSHAAAIDASIGLGIIKGVSDTELDVNGTLTRAMAAKIYAYLTLGEDLAEALAPSASFKDVPVTHWASKYIAYAASTGVLVGVGNGNFEPDTELTGYAFAKILLNALGKGFATNANGVTVNIYEGTYWATLVSKDGNAAGLFTGLKGVNLLGTITRAEAMEMLFKTLKLAGTDGYTALAYSVEATAATGTDKYGRATEYYKSGNKQITDEYSVVADYVYSCVTDTDDDTIVEAFAATKGIAKKDASTKVDDDDIDSSYSAGTVVEMTVVANTDGTYKLSELTTYTYNYYKVADVKLPATKSEKAAAETGKYTKTYDLGSSNKKTDAELPLELAKGDIIAVPVNESAQVIYADAVLLTAKTGAVTATTDKYLVVGGEKLYYASNKLTGDTANFVDTFSYYVSPVGTLALLTVYAEGTTVDYSYGFATAVVATAGVSATDFAAATDASVKVAVVGLDGKTAVLDLALTAKDNKWTVTGVAPEGVMDIVNGTVQAVPATELSGLVKYSTNANGKVVIASITPLVNLATKYDGGKYAFDVETLTSSTVANIVRYDKTTKTYSGTTVTGYKNIPAISAYKANKVNNKYFYDGEAKVLYVLADAETVSTTISEIAYCADAGTELTAKGYAYTFVIDGKTVVYYNNAKTAAVKGTFYKNIVVDAEQKFTALTDDDKAALAVNSATVKTVDAGYFTYGENGVFEYPATCKLIDLSDEGVTAIAEELVVTAIYTANDNSAALIFVMPPAQLG